MKRRVEKRVGDSWEVTEMKDLRDGDEFRLFEADGSPVANGVGKVIGAPFITTNENNEEVWSVEVAG